MTSTWNYSIAASSQPNCWWHYCVRYILTSKPAHHVVTSTTGVLSPCLSHDDKHLNRSPAHTATPRLYMQLKRKRCAVSAGGTPQSDRRTVLAQHFVRTYWLDAGLSIETVLTPFICSRIRSTQQPTGELLCWVKFDISRCDVFLCALPGCRVPVLCWRISLCFTCSWCWYLVLGLDRDFTFYVRTHLLSV